METNANRASNASAGRPENSASKSYPNYREFDFSEHRRKPTRPIKWLPKVQFYKDDVYNVVLKNLLEAVETLAPVPSGEIDENTQLLVD